MKEELLSIAKKIDANPHTWPIKPSKKGIPILSLKKNSRGFYSNEPRRETAILLIYEHQNTWSKNYVIGHLFSKLGSKIGEFVIQELDSHYRCLLELKDKIYELKIDDLSIDGIEGNYWTIDDIDNAKFQLQQCDWTSGKITLIEARKRIMNAERKSNKFRKLGEN